MDGDAVSALFIDLSTDYQVIRQKNRVCVFTAPFDINTAEDKRAVFESDTS